MLSPMVVLSPWLCYETLRLPRAAAEASSHSHQYVPGLLRAPARAALFYPASFRMLDLQLLYFGTCAGPLLFKVSLPWSGSGNGLNALFCASCAPAPLTPDVTPSRASYSLLVLLLCSSML